MGVEKVQMLEQIPLFWICSAEERSLLWSLFEEGKVSKGRILTREGWIGSEFFVVLEGIATVTLRGERLASLGPGSFFGETALLEGAPRSATVTAASEMRLLVLDARRLELSLERGPKISNVLTREIAARLRGAQTPSSDSRTSS